MTKQRFAISASLGASLLLGVQAHAQVNYTSGDLLLNFRDTSAPTSTDDLEVDVGNFATIVNFQGTETLVSAGTVTGVFGAPSVSTVIGLSAAAGDENTDTVYMTRTATGVGVVPANAAGQVPQPTTELVETDIDNIGIGATAGTAVISGAATVPGSTSGNSYQAQGEQSTAFPQNINFGSHESLTASKGGNIESTQDGSGPVYEALWEVPYSGQGLNDTYLGTLTFNQDGSVDYTSGTATPEPSTYALWGATAIVGFAFRRRIRALVA